MRTQFFKIYTANKAVILNALNLVKPCAFSDVSELILHESLCSSFKKQLGI